MAAFLIVLSVFFGFFRESWDLFKQPKYQPFLVWMVILFAIDTILHDQIEGWVEDTSQEFARFRLVVPRLKNAP